MSKQANSRNIIAKEILEISRKINSEQNLSSLLYSIAKETKELVDAELASIFLLDRESNELWSIVTLDGKQIRFDARLGIAGEAVMTGKTINIEDVYKDPRFYKKVDSRSGYKTKSLLVVPLKNYQGEVIGTFQVLNKKGGKFSNMHIKILELLGDQISHTLEKAQVIEELRLQIEQLIKENVQLTKEVRSHFSTQNIIGSSYEIQNVIRLIEQISDSSVDVLINGESGTGKELVAKAIHYNSMRARNTFVELNCASLPQSLVESELFGIEKGVATGVHPRIGRFEQADGGTLFLDEIGDLSLESQAKILRVLQERSIERVGGRKSIPVDVRILAATNKDLEIEIKEGRFREDLYYRLRVIQIHMPSLRDIHDDIPVLVNHFLTKYCQEMNKELMRISDSAMKYLLNYRWPGNVRELENKIKKLVVLTPGKVITEKQIPEQIKKKSEIRPLSSTNLKHRIEDLEREMIFQALQTCNHNKTQAAKMLGLSRWGLIKKIKSYGIES